MALDTKVGLVVTLPSWVEEREGGVEEGDFVFPLLYIKTAAAVMTGQVYWVSHTSVRLGRRSPEDSITMWGRNWGVGNASKQSRS